LGDAVQRFPNNGDVLAAFVRLQLEVTGVEAARRALDQLRAVAPDHSAITILVKAISLQDTSNS
jgi:thioredoxin-like negative regulator of GroEL